MARRPYTKTEQVQTTLTEVDRQRLDAYAEARKQSRADAIRQLVLGGLKEAGNPDSWEWLGSDR